MPTFSDLSLSLKQHPFTGDILRISDVDAVKQSMKNVIFSGPFSTPFNPNSGANIKGLLFEMLTPSTMAVAKRSILLALTEYEPRAVIEDIYVGDDGPNSINIGILFYVVGTTQQQTLNFSMERVR